MTKRACLAWLPLALLVALWPAPSAWGQAMKIATETFFVPARDPGIQLHVRNKRPEGMSTFTADRIVLFVHGATYPSETGFDIPLA